ncbi:MAG: iron-containing alcohol dehydrogenase [Clostridia bacterium]|nr:iron-containing alcohol dehydrogenase [Clostridia bacterium]
MDFDFFMPSRVVSGKSCLINKAELMKQFGSKCGIVTGGTSAKKSGALDDMKKALDSVGISYTVFDGIKPNPLTEDCTAAAKQFIDFGADFIVGIGGGSALDASKAIAVMTANPGIENDDIYIKPFVNSPLPIVLVGTSSGTGSEVSAVSVLTNKSGRKKSIKGPSLYASLVYADSTYTCSMPYSVTVSTALDALAHAVEGFFTEKCTDIPTMFAYKGIPLIWKGLNFLLENRDMLPDEKLREELYMGSLYAGIVLNACGTAFPHPMGYILTEHYGIPHGKACAAFTPALLDRAAVYCPEKLKQIEKMTGETAEEIKRKVILLADIPQIKMTDEQLERYTERFSPSVPGNFLATPGGYTYKEAKDLLKSLYQ